MAEKEIELRERGGELADGQLLFKGDQMRLRVLANLLYQRLFTGTGYDENLRVEFILQAIANSSKVCGGPDAVRAAAAGVEENLPHLRCRGGRGELGNEADNGRDAQERSDLRDIGGTRSQS